MGSLKQRWQCASQMMGTTTQTRHAETAPREDTRDSDVTMVPAFTADNVAMDARSVLMEPMRWTVSGASALVCLCLGTQDPPQTVAPVTTTPLETGSGVTWESVSWVLGLVMGRVSAPMALMRGGFVDQRKKTKLQLSRLMSFKRPQCLLLVSEKNL